MITHYEWAGGREAMLRFGPPVGPTVVLAMPLFEEANRTRAFAVTLMRALGELSVQAMLPDLPGTNESLVETKDATLDNWQSAFAAAAHSANRHGTVHAAAIRGGALVDRTAKVKSRWHFAPVAGQALVRDLYRTRDIAQLGDGHAAPEIDAGETIELAGNLLTPTLLADLRVAAPVNQGLVRTVRLRDDAMPSDRAVDGTALWRRSEPDNDLVLAGVLAADLAAWVRRCEG